MKRLAGLVGALVLTLAVAAPASADRCDRWIGGFAGVVSVGSGEVVCIEDEGVVAEIYVYEDGVLIGGDSGDSVSRNYGTFYGKGGSDSVTQNYGNFFGGPGNDYVSLNFDPGRFWGGLGDDRVDVGGWFNGGPGDDWIYETSGPFFGGGGYDTAILPRCASDPLLASVEEVENPC
jgi:hypothetical protein